MTTDRRAAQPDWSGSTSATAAPQPGDGAREPAQHARQRANLPGRNAAAPIAISRVL